MEPHLAFEENKLFKKLLELKQFRCQLGTSYCEWLIIIKSSFLPRIATSNWVKNIKETNIGLPEVENIKKKNIKKNQIKTEREDSFSFYGARGHLPVTKCVCLDIVEIHQVNACRQKKFFLRYLGVNKLLFDHHKLKFATLWE